MTSVVVANLSSCPEMVAAASRLGEAGLLSRYHVPLAFGRSQERWVRRLPPTLSKPLLRELRRRQTPEGVAPEALRRTALSTDLARVAAARSDRIGRQGKMWWTYRHGDLFDRSLSRSLRATDEHLLAVAGAFARRTVQTANQLDVETWLDFPLPHHASIEATLLEEVRRVPDYACTMQITSSADPAWLPRVMHDQAVAADHVLVLSTYAYNTFLEAGIGEDKLVLTPLGVDTALFQPAPRGTDGIFRIAFVGQITQRKGVSYLVDAFRAAAIPGSELRLTGAVIGSAPWAGIPGVLHRPPCPRVDLPAVYAESDVVVLPSLADGFGLTALEAMSCGRPVIVSEHTFGRDIVEDGVNGWVVPIRDADAIAERLSLLASDADLCAAMGSAARRTAEAFTWSRYGDGLAELIRQAG